MHACIHPYMVVIWLSMFSFDSGFAQLKGKWTETCCSKALLDAQCRDCCREWMPRSPRCRERNILAVVSAPGCCNVALGGWWWVWRLSPAPDLEPHLEFPTHNVVQLGRLRWSMGHLTFLASSHSISREANAISLPWRMIWIHPYFTHFWHTWGWF